MSLFDRLTLGPARRRRRLERQLRDLDWSQGLPPAGPLPGRGHLPRTRRRSWDAEKVRQLFVMVTTVVVMVALVAVFTPGVVPRTLSSRLGLGREPLGQVPDVEGSGSYAFLAHQRGDRDQPVAYDPCREIHVELNPDQGPASAERLLRKSLTILSRATGLKMVYDGTTDRRPGTGTSTRGLGGSTRLGGSAEPVLVSFATAKEVPALKGAVAGVGGSTSVGTSTGPRHYVTGLVTLDADAYQVLARDPEDVLHEQAIMMHELGHLVGLAHVEDPHELMYPENLGRTSFGTGDRIGLAALGKGRCF